MMQVLPRKNFALCGRRKKSVGWAEVAEGGMPCDSSLFSLGGTRKKER